jgi:hypothetical protein
MFTPDQQRSAAELMRVCKTNGRIGLANWTPGGFIGQLFKTIGRHVPPAPELRSPALWGTRERITELFGSGVKPPRITTRSFSFRYRSPQHWLDVFRTYYGPVLKTFAALPAEAQSALSGELLALAEQFNCAGDGTMVVPSEYLEVVLTRR